MPCWWPTTAHGTEEVEMTLEWVALALSIAAVVCGLNAWRLWRQAQRRSSWKQGPLRVEGSILGPATTKTNDDRRG